MKRMAKIFTGPIIKRKYRYDWQFAIDISKRPYLRTATIVIFLMPIVLEIKDVYSRFDVPTNFWFLWGSSIAFVLAIVILNFCCPRFILEYRDYGEYLRRNHSHRWIVWEFYNNIKSLKGWQEVVRETEEKNVAIDISLTNTLIKDKCEAAFSEKELQSGIIEIKKPINHNRDIYMPIAIDGKIIVLGLEEKEVELKDKEKELFWILYTLAVQEKPAWRVVFWVLSYGSIILSSAIILSNILKVI